MASGSPRRRSPETLPRWARDRAGGSRSCDAGGLARHILGTGHGEAHHACSTAASSRFASLLLLGVKTHHEHHRGVDRRLAYVDCHRSGGEERTDKEADDDRQPAGTSDVGEESERCQAGVRQGGSLGMADSQPLLQPPPRLPGESRSCPLRRPGDDRRSSGRLPQHSVAACSGALPAGRAPVSVGSRSPELGGCELGEGPARGEESENGTPRGGTCCSHGADRP